MTAEMDIAAELDTCMRCGYCKSSCPTWREAGWESASPRGRAFLLGRMARASPLDRAFGLQVEVTDRFFEHFHYCTLCGMCSEVCEVSIPLHRIWEETRESLSRAGWGPLPGHAALMQSLHANRNPYGQPPAKRVEWMGDRRPPPMAEVAWFVGCSESYNQFQAAEAGMRLLDAAKVPWTTLGAEEWCCGDPHVKTGVTADLDEHARHNVDALEATGASRVVSGCPGCTLNLGQVYPRRGMGGDFEVVHLVELLARLVDEGRLAPSKRFEGRVIYHDPCELGRVGGRVYEAPRRLLDAACGKGEWLEFPQSRDLASCCGGGGAFKAVDDGAAVAIAARKLEVAIELGADTVVSACPTCRFNLNHGVQALKRRRRGGEGAGERGGPEALTAGKGGAGKADRVKLRVMDIKELLERCL